MLDTRKLRPQTSMITEPLAIVVEHLDRRSPATLVARHVRGGVLRSALYLPPRAEVLGYLYPEPYENLALTVEFSVLAQAGEYPQGDGRELYLVAWNWAYCAAGSLGLRDQLNALFGCPREGAGDYGVFLLASGGLADFPAMSQEEVRAFSAILGAPFGELSSGSDEGSEEGFGSRAARPLERLRSDDHVRIHIPCVFIAGGEHLQGRVYTITRDGLFVVTPNAAPEEGVATVLKFSLRLNEGLREVSLRGVVRWRMENSRAGDGGGFGMSVESVDDGASGRLFRTFLDRALVDAAQEGGAAPSGAELAGGADLAGDGEGPWASVDSRRL